MYCGVNVVQCVAWVVHVVCVHYSECGCVLCVVCGL